MQRVNNVVVERLKQTEDSFRRDLASARRQQVLEGEWVLGDGAPQFRAFITYEGGKTTFEMDNPTFMGGDGALPGPMHYCFSGLAACYTSTFAIVAAEKGILLRRLRVRVEATVNFSRVFGLADAPVMEEVHVQLEIDSPASDAELQEVEELALQRCPVVWTLTHSVPLRSSWRRYAAAEAA
ncbi:MAG: OsmC family protein [Bacteroidota bacterium]|nr:OsmC family protein [Bacteroidota bacterium]